MATLSKRQQLRRLQFKDFMLGSRSFVGEVGPMKVVGKRNRLDERRPRTPEEALRRAGVLQAQAELLNPFPRPRGFVFKAKTREEYERWRRAQPNPRLW